MTWADIAAKNAPPPEEQPKPDQSLLEGHFEGETERVSLPTGHGGVTVVEHDFREHPHTADTGVTPETVKRDEEFAKAEAEAKVKAAQLEKEAEEKAAEVKEEASKAAAKAEKKAGEVKEVVKDKAAEAKKDIEKKSKEAKAWAKKEGKELKKEAKSTWATVSAALSQPRYFVPLISAIDAAIVGTLAYSYVTRREARVPIDQRTISTVAVGLGALFSLEAYGATSYFSKRDYNGNKKI